MKKIKIFLLIAMVLTCFSSCKSSNPLEQLPFECTGLPNPDELCKEPQIPDGKSVDADIELTQCQNLDQAGKIYLLKNNVEAEGTCFEITADNITLDLGGKSVVYAKSVVTEENTVAGILVSGRSGIEIRNGTIEEGNTSNAKAHPVHAYGLRNGVIRNIHAIAKGIDSCSLHLMYAHGVKIYHNRLENLVTQVTNRHYPGDSVIRVAGGDGAVEIYENLIESGPHWGIKPVSDDFSSVKVYKNCIKGMKSLYANGYAIGVYSKGMEVYENYINTESRGLHVTNDSLSVHDNYVEVWEVPNEEYPSPYWTHGIKLEGATNSKVFCNSVLSKADKDHGNAHALNVSVEAASNNEIYNNLFEARSFDEEFSAYSFVSLGTEPANNILISENIFKADTRIFYIDWDGASGLTFRDNVFEKAGMREDFRTIHIGAGTDFHSLDNKLINTELVGGADLRDILKWSGTTFSLYTGWNLDVSVRTSGGSAVSGATVEIKDKNGYLVDSGSTASDGSYAGYGYEFKASGEPGDTTVNIEELNDNVVSATSAQGSGSAGVKVEESKDVLLTVQ